MEIRPAHMGLTVRDLDEGIRWYTENLGFSFVSRKSYPQLDNLQIAFLQLGDFELELFCPVAAKDAPKDIYSDNSVIGVKHLALAVDNLEALLQKLDAANVARIFRTEMESDLVCFVRDCCGTPVELIERGGALRKEGCASGINPL